jgi:hypothetical protein
LASATQVLIGAVSGSAGIKFGSAGDTNLYRSAADTLKTDDSFVVGGTLTLSGDPSSAMQAATKQYVDAAITGQDSKISVRAATTANITLSGAQTIDGVSVVAGDRVLVKDQSTGSQNGIYVAAAGAWSRSTDADTSTEVNPGFFTFVEEGTSNGNIAYVLTTDAPITLGTTALTFQRFSSPNDHSLLSNLTTGDPHTQYLLTSGSRTTTGVTLTANAAGTIPLSVIGAGSPTAPLQVWQGNGTSRIGASGGLALNGTPATSGWELFRINDPVTPDAGAVAIITPQAAGTKGLIVQGRASQTADLQQWQKSDGTIYTAIDKDGKLVFGPSGSQDTNLYRFAANVLATDDQLVVVRANMSQVSLSTNISGDTTSRFALYPDGRQVWGDGANPFDTNLYRSAADTLKTDDSLVVDGASGISIGAGQITQVRASNGLTAYATYVSGEANARFSFNNNGVLNWGAGGATAQDTNLYRSAANELKTDDSLVVGGSTTVAGTLTASGDLVTAGASWTTRPAAVDTLSWQGIAYGNGLFVATAINGTGNGIMTSPDGINWTTRIPPFDLQWGDIVYGNGLFVAVASSGTGNRVMTSPDGINWASRTSAADSGWSSITYGNGLFVAVSTGSGTTANRVMTSPDGITWTGQSSANTNSWTGVTYGNGLFVAVASTGTGSNSTMYSSDGVTWTQGTIPDNSWSAITYGNGLFVAVGGGGSNRAYTSPDGLTWTARNLGTSSWQAVTYGNGMFVALASALTNRVATSGKILTSTAPANNIFQGGLTVNGGLSVGGATLPNDDVIAFGTEGTLTVRTGKGRFRFPFAAVLLGVSASVDTAPTGSAVILDLNKNGTTMFTTQANRPTISANTNATTTEVTNMDVTAIASGDYLTVDIDQIGSTVAGSDLVVTVRFKRP